ncbi:MAG: hypothetical protein ABI972_32315, partial [Acidobacteriota bacterium]
MLLENTQPDLVFAHGMAQLHRFSRTSSVAFGVQTTCLALCGGGVLAKIRQVLVLVVMFASVLALSGDSDVGYSPRSKAHYASNDLVNFVRPGLVIKITAADIAADGTITATVLVTDPKGLPLDRLGVTTPGAVSLSFVAATIPKTQDQYTSYTTRTASGAAIASTQQAGADANGTFTTISDGQYTYRFNTKAPAGFDRTATHTIGVYGNRNLTEFELP